MGESFERKMENIEGRMAEFYGPDQIDQAVRRALFVCWRLLPKERRTPDELERQVRRVVDRAIKDFRDDFDQFGRPA